MPPSGVVGVRKQIVEQFLGPIPSPELLKQYGEFMPELPERIVTMAEKAQQHQHDQVNKAIEYTRGDIRRRQYLGALVSLSSLATAAFCAWIDAPLLIALGAILPGLSTVFYWLFQKFTN